MAKLYQLEILGNTSETAPNVNSGVPSLYLNNKVGFWSLRVVNSELLIHIIAACIGAYLGDIQENTLYRSFLRKK